MSRLQAFHVDQEHGLCNRAYGHQIGDRRRMSRRERYLIPPLAQFARDGKLRRGTITIKNKKSGASAP